MPPKTPRPHDASQRSATSRDAPRRSTTPHDAPAPRRAPRILSLVGQKGGVGKTTITISLAVEAAERGLRVLVVDADPQGSARMWAEIAQELGTSVPLVVSTPLGAQSHRQIPEMAAPYDLVLIDCPPRLDEVQRLAMMVSELVLLPVGPAPFDVLALTKAIELVGAAQEVRPSLRAAVVITRTQPKTTLARDLRAQLAGIRPPVLASELGFRAAYQQMIAAGMGPTTFEPAGAAAREVRALCDELEIR